MTENQKQSAFVLDRYTNKNLKIVDIPEEKAATPDMSAMAGMGGMGGMM